MVSGPCRVLRRLLRDGPAVCNGLAMTDELMGTTEAIRTLGISRATLTRWAAAGKIPTAGKLEGNGGLIFRAADVHALAATLPAAAAAP